MTRPSTEEAELAQVFRELDPHPAAVRRMESAIVAAVFATPSESLVAEWLALMSSRPLVNAGLVLAGAAALVVGHPIGALLGLLVRALAAQG